MYSVDDTFTPLECPRRNPDRIHAKVNREESVDVKLNHQGQLGWHLRVTRKDEKSIRADKKYLMLETRKDGYRFAS
jgi:hypothetical protein